MLEQKEKVHKQELSVSNDRAEDEENSSKQYGLEIKELNR